MRHMLKCTKCSAYTFSDSCACGGAAVSPKPAKYSPEDKYADYRRKAKREEWEKKGMI